MMTTSVLFNEFSKGGSLQKSLSEVVDRLAPMMGFNMRVLERGGTRSSTLQQEPLELSQLWKRGVQNLQTTRRQEGGL